MKKALIFIFLSIFTAGIACAQGAKSDKDKIESLIMDFYHVGHVTSHPKYYETILHDEWKMFSIGDDGDLFQVDKETYLSWYDPKEADKSLQWKTDIHYIDVSGHLAAAKVSIGNQKFDYIDYFNMMKIDEKWWIVHKISRSK